MGVCDIAICEDSRAGGSLRVLGKKQRPRFILQVPQVLSWYLLIIAGVLWLVLFSPRVLMIRKAPAPVGVWGLVLRGLRLVLKDRKRSGFVRYRYCPACRVFGYPVGGRACNVIKVCAVGCFGDAVALVERCFFHCFGGLKYCDNSLTRTSICNPLQAVRKAVNRRIPRHPAVRVTSETLKGKTAFGVFR